MNHEVFNSLVTFLSKLEQTRISYTLAHNRDDAIMALVAVPGERWEIEFKSNGAVEIEKFTSNGEIYDADSLDELFARYAEQEENAESSKATE